MSEVEFDWAKTMENNNGKKMSEKLEINGDVKMHHNNGRGRGRGNFNRGGRGRGRENNSQDQSNNQRKNRHRRLIKKNTESFEPDHSKPDMRIVIADGSLPKFDKIHSENDVVVVKNMFKPEDKIYERLLEEIGKTGNTKDIWKLWHGDTHYIADDKRNNWKKSCPLFIEVTQRLADYFDMDVKATRFNWYKDLTEWKPYHHDAAAVDPRKMDTQNFTVGVSFGATREISFQHAKNNTTVAIPLDDCSVYTFGKKVNIAWRHGIPQIEGANSEESPNPAHGRISVIAWGKNHQEDI